MPDAPSPPPAGTPPHLRGATLRYRCLLARGCNAETAMAELVAYLVVLRPGLPRVLAYEQAEAVATACGPVPRAPAHPPRGLLVVLAQPAQGGRSEQPAEAVPLAQPAEAHPSAEPAEAAASAPRSEARPASPAPAPRGR
jgi:hypothetical protein